MVEWWRLHPSMRKGSRLERKSRLAPVGRRKKREQREGKADGPLCDKVREMPCCVCGKPGPSHPHHVSGGTLRHDYLPDGTPNVAPLCFDHHTGEQGVHTLGPETFAEKFDVTLSKVAERVARDVE